MYVVEKLSGIDHTRFIAPPRLTGNWLHRCMGWLAVRIMEFCDCGCHYDYRYGWVVMGGCRWHD